MIYTILGSFCSFLNWEGADIPPLIRPRTIPADNKGQYRNLPAQKIFEQRLESTILQGQSENIDTEINLNLLVRSMYSLESSLNAE